MPRVLETTADGHTYIGHNYIGHNYIGHDYIGHNYVDHNYTEGKALVRRLAFRKPLLMATTM